MEISQLVYTLLAMFQLVIGVATSILGLVVLVLLVSKLSKWNPK